MSEQEVNITYGKGIYIDIVKLYEVLKKEWIRARLTREEYAKELKKVEHLKISFPLTYCEKGEYDYLEFLCEKHNLIFDGKDERINSSEIEKAFSCTCLKINKE